MIKLKTQIERSNPIWNKIDKYIELVSSKELETTFNLTLEEVKERIAKAKKEVNTYKISRFLNKVERLITGRFQEERPEGKKGQHIDIFQYQSTDTVMFKGGTFLKQNQNPDAQEALKKIIIGGLKSSGILDNHTYDMTEGEHISPYVRNGVGATTHKKIIFSGGETR